MPVPAAGIATDRGNDHQRLQKRIRRMRTLLAAALTAALLCGCAGMQAGKGAASNDTTRPQSNDTQVMKSSQETETDEPTLLLRNEAKNAVDVLLNGEMISVDALSELELPLPANTTNDLSLFMRRLTDQQHTGCGGFVYKGVKMLDENECTYSFASDKDRVFTVKGFCGITDNITFYFVDCALSEE